MNETLKELVDILSTFDEDIQQAFLTIARGLKGGDSDGGEETQGRTD